MASSFGKIVVGTYVEIKRSDGKFRSAQSFSPLVLCKLFEYLCCRGAVEYSNRWRIKLTLSRGGVIYHG